EEMLDSLGDEPGFFQFSQTNSFQVDESAGFATVVVTRAGGTVGAVSVDYSTSNGSAVSGSDYTATSGTLTFANGQYLESFKVPILNDALSESTETFHISLSHPTGGANIGGLRTSADIKILDDDGHGNFQFNNPAYLVNETDHTLTITVNRTGGANG